MVGKTTIIVRRPSLGDPYLGADAQAAGVVLLPRISCKPGYGLALGAGGTASGATASMACVRLPFTPNPSPCPSAPSSCTSTSFLSGPAPPTGPAGAAATAVLTSVAVAVAVAGAAAAPAVSQTRPLQWMADGLALCLRERLGMQLFNFDLICPDHQPNPDERLYFVIDINYFPGELSDGYTDGRADGQTASPR